MSQAITVSYHLPVLVKGFINDQSKKLKLSKGNFLAYLIEDYQKTKQENETLKAYFSIATDEQYKAEQIAEAELDLQAELAHNSELSA